MDLKPLMMLRRDSLVERVLRGEKRDDLQLWPTFEGHRTTIEGNICEIVELVLKHNEKSGADRHVEAVLLSDFAAILAAAGTGGAVVFFSGGHSPDDPNRDKHETRPMYVAFDSPVPSSPDNYRLLRLG